MRTFTDRRCTVVLLLLSLSAFYRMLPSSPAAAFIYRWDNGELITERDAGPGASLYEMDLSYADLAGALLSHQYFAHSNLTYAHLMGANLMRADFYGATLTNVDFGDANLMGTSSWHASLTDANFSAAVVTGAYFRSTGLGHLPSLHYRRDHPCDRAVNSSSLWHCCVFPHRYYLSARAMC